METQEYTTISGESKSYNCIKRWCVIHKITGHRATDSTYVSCEEANEAVKNIFKNNPKSITDRFFGQGLDVAEFWCYANSGDAIGPVEPKAMQILIKSTKKGSKWAIYPNRRKPDWVQSDMDIEATKEDVLRLLGYVEFHEL